MEDALKETKACDVCAKTFDTNYSFKIYCSKECSRESNTAKSILRIKNLSPEKYASLLEKNKEYRHYVKSRKEKEIKKYKKE